MKPYDRTEELKEIIKQEIETLKEYDARQLAASEVNELIMKLIDLCNCNAILFFDIDWEEIVRFMEEDDKE